MLPDITLLHPSARFIQTALAAKIATDSDFPLVRLISPDAMIGMQDYQKCQYLFKASPPPPLLSPADWRPSHSQVFSDAYRSPLSVIFIDDIERIIEYTPIGHRCFPHLPSISDRTHVVISSQILESGSSDSADSPSKGSLLVPSTFIADPPF